MNYDNTFSAWLDANCEYLGYGEWTYIDDNDNSFEINERYDSEVDGYDIWSNEAGTTVVICGSESECYAYFN